MRDLLFITNRFYDARLHSLANRRFELHKKLGSVGDHADSEHCITPVRSAFPDMDFSRSGFTESSEISKVGTLLK